MDKRKFTRWRSILVSLTLIATLTVSVSVVFASDETTANVSTESSQPALAAESNSDTSADGKSNTNSTVATDVSPSY